MLLLSRRIGQRVRILCNDTGETVWLTQNPASVTIATYAGSHEAVACEPVTITINSKPVTIHYVTRTVNAKTRVPSNSRGVGIDAPKVFDILREELIRDGIAYDQPETSNGNV